MKAHFTISKKVVTLIMLTTGGTFASDLRENQNSKSAAFQPIPMRSGFAISPEQAYREEQERLHHQAAREAQTVMPTAQQLFEFKYNFVIPSFVMKELPPEIRGRLYLLSVPSDWFSVRDTQEVCRQKISHTLMANGITDLYNPSIQSSMALTRLINEVGFSPDQNDYQSAVKFNQLGIKLNALPENFLAAHERDKMMAVCFIKAANHTLKVAEKVTTLEQPEAFINAGQLKYWAAYRIPDEAQKAALSIEAFKHLLQAEQLSREMGQDVSKIQSITRANYHLFYALMQQKGFHGSAINQILQGALLAMNKPHSQQG
jgi:hypothetical protein